MPPNSALLFADDVAAAQGKAGMFDVDLREIPNI
jgi:hypothetical protein